MTRDQLRELAEGMADATKKHVPQQLEPLKMKIAELEARPPVGVAYCGVFEPGSGRAYAPGSLVTRSGGLWLALKATTATALST